MLETKRLLAAASPSRSAYVARLRRAFLLRVHPDRFRTQPKLIKEQSSLIQALSDRLVEPDFLRYLTPTISLNQISISGEKAVYHQQKFSIETKSGVVKTSISLNESPIKILQSMAQLCNFPPPPPPPQQPISSERAIEFQSKNGQAQTTDEPDLFQFLRYGAYALQKKRRNQNTNLIQYLESSSLVDDIKDRRLHRINAASAVLQIRRLYKFISVDGTRLGWNSASLAICLQRLIALHEEHHNNFRTSSFYPFRLILSSDEFQRKVDLWAGDIRLNPASTSLQWLSILENVTDESVHALKTNQQILRDNLAIVEDMLQLRVIKGHTSDAEDYFECIRRLGTESQIAADEWRLAILSNKSSLVIESDQACRRGNLRKDGSFEVSTSMSMDAIRSTMSRYAKRSNEILNAEYITKQKCSTMIRQVTEEFGVQKISKANIVSNNQMLQCLTMLLKKDHPEKGVLRRLLAGHSIAISTGGNLHLGDDGSIMIPWNLS